MPVFGVILVRPRENVDQNNSEYGHFLRSERFLILYIFAWFLYFLPLFFSEIVVLEIVSNIFCLQKQFSIIWINKVTLGYSQYFVSRTIDLGPYSSRAKTIKSSYQY